MVSTVAARPSLHARQGIRCGGANAGAGRPGASVSRPRGHSRILLSG
ncbi:hypothetical protein PJI17_07245 [Mycobacterium kansasii]|nr:hypothetical protein MKSMC1_02690 [Mycobacterium kansasii]